MDSKITKALLYLALSRSYSKDTAYPGTWSKGNPYIGQCAVASMVAYDYLGGKIAKMSLPELPSAHYFNLLDSEVYDFTRKQFSASYQKQFLKYSDYRLKNKGSIRGFGVQERYKILKQRVKNFIKDFFQLQEEINRCRKCKFVEHLKGPIINIGNDFDILFIGEAPAPNGWRKSGKAFYTPEGELLATGRNLIKMLKILNINLEDITYTEIVKCRPDNRKYLEKAAKNCHPFLLRQLNLLKPKLILPLGLYATVHLTEALGIREKRSFKELKGRLLVINDFLIYPLQHPSPINPYGIKFNISALKHLIRSDKYKQKLGFAVFLDKFNCPDRRGSNGRL